MIMGVVAAVAISHTANLQDSIRITGELEKIKGHLRYAQARAMEDDQFSYGVWFKADQYAGYRFPQPPQGTSLPHTASPFSFPGEESPRVNLIPGPAITNACIVSFSKKGRPMVNGEFQGTTLDFGDFTITITEDTGFIP